MSWHQPDCQWFEDKKPWKHPKSTNVGACVYAFSSKPKMHPVQFNWHSQCSGSLPKDTWHRSDLTDAFFAKQKMHWNMWHQILGVERVLYMLYAFSGQAKNASEWKMHLKPIQVKTSLVMEFHHCVCFPSENASCQGWSVLSSNFSNAFSEGKLTHWRNSGFYERERTTPIARHTIANARPQAAKNKSIKCTDLLSKVEPCWFSSLQIDGLGWWFGHLGFPYELLRGTPRIPNHQPKSQFYR